MLNPAIGKLIEKNDNRYKLVLEIAEEARNILAEANEKGEIIVEKPVNLAIEKIASKLD